MTSETTEHETTERETPEHETPEEAVLACGVARELEPNLRRQVEAAAAGLRAADPAFARWAEGYGAIAHDPLTQARIHALVQQLVAEGRVPDADAAYRRLAAADRLASAGSGSMAANCSPPTSSRTRKGTPAAR